MADTIDAVLQAWQDTQRLQHDKLDEAPSDGLLYAGNIHDSVPRKLVLDPQLSPRDKLTWQILRLYAVARHGAAFPSYSELQKLLAACPARECASRSTVSHCLIMLRLTRWLSLCQCNRDPLTGRILGNIYALHDEPLALPDALRLDSGYLQLLSDSICHTSKSLRLTAQAVWQALNDDPPSSQQGAESCDSTRDALSTLAGLSETASEEKSKIVENSAICPLVLNQDSGHVLNTVKRKRSSTWAQWPDSLPLTSAERGAVWRAMSELPDRLCQEVLDNCGRRIAAGGISNPLGYVLATLRKAKRGEFNLFKRQKPGRQRGVTIPAETKESSLIENLKYLCQQHKNRR